MRKFLLPGIFILSVSASVAQNCAPFDYTFGNGGAASAFTATNNSTVSSAKVLVQPDNKIVQVFTSFGSNGITRFGVARYNSNGSVDSTFGTNGVQVQVGGPNNHANSAALQQDGKIVVAGTNYDGYNSTFVVARYQTNGNLDSSFGTNGMVLALIGPNYDGANDVAIQPDGKILIAGYSNNVNYTASFAVLRLLPNGSFDANFGQNGSVIFHVGPFVSFLNGYASEYANSVALQTDGKIIVAGTSYAYLTCYDYYGGIYCEEAFGMARLNPNGSVDSSFGINGKVRDTLLLRVPSAIALQPDGKLVVTGRGQENGFITERYKTNGTLDSSYGTNGKVVTTVSSEGPYAESTSIHVLPNGKIVVSGVSEPGAFSLAAVRYNSDGSLDNSFNGNGKVVFNVSQSPTEYGSSVTSHNGKILIGARSKNTLTNLERIIVVRLDDNFQPLMPNIIAGGPLEFCQGNNVRLVSSEQGSIQWYRNNIAIAGANDTVYTTSGGGSFKVRVGNASGCGVSSPVVVTVYSPPPKPPIYWNTPQFSTTSNYRHYEWLLNDIPIPGVDTNIYRPTQAGKYRVTVIESTDCRNTSDVFELRVLAVPDILIGDSKLRYYPNPVSDVLSIDVSNTGTKKLEARLFDLSGKLVLSQILNQNHNQLELTKLSTGIYQLVISDHLDRVSVKLIVSR